MDAWRFLKQNSTKVFADWLRKGIIAWSGMSFLRVWQKRAGGDMSKDIFIKRNRYGGNLMLNDKNPFPERVVQGGEKVKE